MSDNNVLLKPKQVMEKLQVGESWLSRKARAGIIPHIRIGGTIRFREGDLNKWINDHSVKGCQKV